MHFVACLLIGIAALAAIPETLNATPATVGGRPGMPRTDEPRSQSIFIHTLEDGSSVSDSLLVINTVDEEQVVAIYAVDAQTTNTGAFTCEQRSEVVDAAGAWVIPERSQITVGAKQDAKVGITLTVPDGVPAGEYNACIVIEQVDEQSHHADGIRLRTRSAIRVALTVPGVLERAVSIVSYDTARDGNDQLYSLTLHNEGNVSADVQATVLLKNIFGMSMYKNGGEYPVLAGKDLTLVYKDTDSPAFGGWYFAEAFVTYDTRTGVFGVDDPSWLTTVKAPGRLIFIPPQPVEALFELIVAAGLVAIACYYGTIWRARRTWVAYTAKNGDNLQQLAGRHKVGWRRVAWVNKLKAPYPITAGKTLLLPKKTTGGKSA
jgi:hypothetical protein